MGVLGRLRDHAACDPRSRLWFAVLERYIVPRLTPAQRRQLRSGKVLQRDHVRRFMEGLRYRYVPTDVGDTARQLEQEIRRSGLGGRLPVLNAAAAATDRAVREALPTPEKGVGPLLHGDDRHDDRMVIKKTATEVKAKILSLLDDVEAGQEVEITRRGRTVARLVAAAAAIARW